MGGLYPNKIGTGQCRVKGQCATMVSDVPGLQISGFGRAGLDPFGLRAGPGFYTSGFGLFFGLFKDYKYSPIYIVYLEIETV